MKKKLKWNNIITLIVIIVSFIMFCLSIIDIIKWYFDSNNTDKQIKKIQDIVEINEVTETDNKNIEIIEQNSDIEKSNSYWEYIKMNLINVNFKNLKKINSDTLGWIQVNGTNINYPFVQTDNNDFYLTHSYDKTYNNAGWVFLDYRNDINNLSNNTIIYAHGRSDKTMFGSLKTILKSDWLNNKNNYIVKMSTEFENSLWQIFSVYKIPTTNDYIKTDFNKEKEYEEWLKTIKERSNYNFNTIINENDKILTLSTCYNKKEKLVLHAKLIKKETR